MIPGRVRADRSGAAENNEEDAMKRSVLMFGLVLAAAILAGCATAEKRDAITTGTQCNGLATVTVSGITASPPSLDLDPDPVCINFNSGTAQIRWTFAQGGFVFPDNAITWSATPSYRGTVLQQGQAYQVVIDPTGVSQWKYTIKVRSNTNPPRTWTCDPTIINRDTLILARTTVSCTTAP